MESHKTVEKVIEKDTGWNKINAVLQKQFYNDGREDKHWSCEGEAWIMAWRRRMNLQLLFVILSLMEKNERLQLHKIYVAGAEDPAIDALYKPPLEWLPMAQSMVEELGLSIVEETRILEEEVMEMTLAAMMETLVHLEAYSWGRMFVVAAEDPSYLAVERIVLEGMVIFRGCRAVLLSL